MLDLIVEEAQKKKLVVDAPTQTQMRRSKYSIEEGPSYDLGYDFGTPSFDEYIRAAAGIVSDTQPPPVDAAHETDNEDMFQGLNSITEMPSISEADPNDGMGCTIDCGVVGCDYEYASEFMLSNKAAVSGMKLLRKQAADYMFSYYAQKCAPRYTTIFFIS